MKQLRYRALILFWLMLLLLPAPIFAQDTAATATPVPNLDLPDWLHDSNTEVLVAFAYESNDTLGLPTFINAATGERFIIDWTYVDHADWIHAEDAVYMRLTRNSGSSSTGFDEFVNLRTGDLTRLPLRDDRAPQPMTPIMQPLDNGAGLSVSLSVTADIVLPAREDGYTVTNQLNLKLTQSANGSQTSIREWSVGLTSVDQFSVQWLAEGTYLGVWTGRRLSSGITGNISIYNTEGQALMHFENAGNARWFQGDEPLILFTESTAAYSTICRVDVEQSQRHCDFLNRWQFQNETTIEQYDWSLDGHSIIFSYRDLDEANGGMCVYDWETERIDCPIERSVSTGRFADRYRAEVSDPYGLYTYSGVIEDADPWNTEIQRERGICMLHRGSFAADCITDEVLPPDTFYDSTRWSPSRRYLAFTYTGQHDAGRDGLCIFDAKSAAVSCPVRADDLIDGFIEVYSWSPDSRYIALVYTGFGPLSDDKSFSRFGIVDVENGFFRDEGFATFEHRLGERWRPPLE